MTKYRNHNTRAILRSEQYAEHVRAMTSEDLHGKAEIAEELAARDIEIARMRHRIECLRGGLKSASGWLREFDDHEFADKCLESVADREIKRLRAELARVTAERDEAEAECKRLRKAIERAPHEMYCSSREGGRCDCFKRDALKEGE